MTGQLTQVTIVNKAIWKLQHGEMAYDDNQQQWFLGCPSCEGVANLGGHTVTRSNDLVTVSPSILCSCGAHYFVDRNLIRWT